MPTEVKHRLLIMAGGTGGHVMPALAVAQKLIPKGIEIHWLGTRHGMEADLVGKYDIQFHSIDIKGLRGKGKLSLLLAPFKITRALWQAIRVLRKVRPDTVMSMGGYVAGPGGVAAWLLRIPLVVHEQNAISGLTNRLLAPFASKILTAFPKTFKHSKVVMTGNPVRESIVEVGNLPREIKAPIRLLVIGGSLGARSINQTVPKALAKLQDTPISVWHQTGKNVDEVKKSYKGVLDDAKVEPFIEDMAAAYRWADLVIARAGALTIAELAAAGVPSILIPFPYAVDDHQSYNARYLTNAGAAILLPEKELTPDSLCQLITNLASHHELLVEMGQKGHALSKPHATDEVAKLCIEERRGKQPNIRAKSL